MKKGWSTGKILGVVFGSIAAAAVLYIAFVISVFQLTFFVGNFSGNNGGEYNRAYNDDDSRDRRNGDSGKSYNDGDYGFDYDYGYGHDYDYDYGYDHDYGFGHDYDHDYSYDHDYDYGHDYDYDYDDILPNGDEQDGEYYEFENSIRTDLPYQVELELYERDDLISDGAGKEILSFSYPVVSGDAPNLDGINRAVYAEIDEVEEYMVSAAELLSDEDIFEFTGTGYVTYMSEEILSVIYVEYGYLNDEFLESYVISLNFDMQTGMILSNLNLIDINDDFSVDFRERCERQNGEISGLYYLSDQQITSYLTDEDYLIIFYTPLGMEIGFNYYDGWVTVTYKDYDQFKKHF